MFFGFASPLHLSCPAVGDFVGNVFEQFCEEENKFIQARVFIPTLSRISFMGLFLQTSARLLKARLGCSRNVDDKNKSEPENLRAQRVW